MTPQCWKKTRPTNTTYRIFTVWPQTSFLISVSNSPWHLPVLQSLVSKHTQRLSDFVPGIPFSWHVLIPLSLFDMHILSVLCARTCARLGEFGENSKTPSLQESCDVVGIIEQWTHTITHPPPSLYIFSILWGFWHLNKTFLAGDRLPLLEACQFLEIALSLPLMQTNPSEPYPLHWAPHPNRQ